jgi:cell division protein ZapE
MNRTEALAALQEGPMPGYRARLALGELAADPAQALAAERLQGLWAKLRGYDPSPALHEAGGFLSRFVRRKRVDDHEDRPNGLYIAGDVGRGKSMLMDLFFAAAQVTRKQRLHFHQFMQGAHRRIHDWKKANPDTDDPIPPLASQIASEAALLCFDEFQVNDIADAMILGRLFEALFKRGVVVVATSNTAPDDLFAGQPGRDAFLPFIALLKQNLDVLFLEGARDYRRTGMHGHAKWHVPAGSAAEAALDAAFMTLSAGAAPAPRRLTVMGRAFAIPAAAEGVARFDFSTLCGTALGAGDYLALATHFPALVLDRVPRLGPDNHNEARRFITLIDALYDHRVKLVASADALPDKLYEEGHGAPAFHRTASRLEEMQTESWWALPHLP